MKKYKIGILGATGAVGQEMLKVLQEYEIPVSELRPLASAPATFVTPFAATVSVSFSPSSV